jgi:acetyl-CoA carboxylase carboxyltransferase component
MDKEFNKNEDRMNMMVSDLNRKLQKIHKGGGDDKIKKHKAKGKLTARDRILELLDNSQPQLEVGAFAGYEMYKEYGGCPSAGVVVMIGSIQKKQVIVVANDATVKAGAWFPITGKKNLRAQEIAIENKIPIIYLVDSAGVFLPLQDEIFPDKEHFGRIFRNNAVMSSMGIPQIAAVMGSCVAGGAYLPIMSDEALIVKKTGTIFLAGSYLVKAAIGEDIDNETLGGSETHCEISGVTDYECENDNECLKTIRELVDKFGETPKAGFSRTKSIEPKHSYSEIYGILPYDRAKPYESKDIIHRLVDDSKFTEYKAGFGKSILCGYARIDGWSVGIIMNQRKVVKTKKGEMHFGGVIYNDSADKSARFIMSCNQKRVPLVFIHDVTGFMVGSRSEHAGIIKDGAKMVNAVSNSIVPKFSIVVGNSYGAGNYAMCGKAFDPRLIVAWPTAKIAVMGGSQAAKVLLQIQMGSKKAKGEKVSEEEQKKMLKKIKDRYDNQTTPEYAAARLWVDAIIDPLETRKVISLGIDTANNAPIDKGFNTGVIQT